MIFLWWNRHFCFFILLINIVVANLLQFIKMSDPAFALFVI